MKYKSQFVLIIIPVLVLIACSSATNASKDRGFSNPYEELVAVSETRKTLLILTARVTSSDSIELCSNGQKLIRRGKEILPYLQKQFRDSTITGIYSKFNERNLTVGETAILLSSSIEQIPIFQVIGVSQCVPPFEDDVEKFLWRIKFKPELFYENYDEWLHALN